MDDDQVLQCQLELMHALQTKKLRPVQPEEKPAWIGGLKKATFTSFVGASATSTAGFPGVSGSLLDLQGEFVKQSLAMQERLRPQLERMAEIRKQGVDNERWQATLRELRAKNRDPLGDINNYSRSSEQHPRLLFQLEETVKSIPGWLTLQEEIRKTDARNCLDPVEYEGFYVIRASKNDVCNIK